MAWLNTTPKPDSTIKPSKRTKTAAAAPRFSRLDLLKRDKITPQMPPNPAPHIVEWLIDIGLSESHGMGQSPISWREINEWQRATSIELAPWEAKLIRTLSVAYLAEGRIAESETCPPPWRGEVSQREREVEKARLQMVLG